MGDTTTEVRIDQGTGGEQKEVVLGLVTAPGMVEDLADELGDDLRAILPRRLPIVTWNRHRARGAARRYDVLRDDGTVRFMTAVVRGNLRLLLGMVGANRPWRLAAGLYRALTAAIGTAAFGLASTGVWHIAEGLSIPRSLTLSLAAVAVTCGTLIGAHRLWERSPPGIEARERVALFNLATTLTVAFGVLTLYMALFVTLTACGIALIVPDVLGAELGHPANLGDYLQLTVVVSMLATVGAALWSDEAVREAAYGYHADD
jgi:uncharacterized membrane protein